ncbi:MAG: cytochrome b N-terminal domain-containing protein [bacterium]|nr:MAG: cytochrome b N-terminal domain-containing protein [bacterium]
MSAREHRQDRSLLKDLLDWVGVRGLLYGPIESRLSVRGAMEAALRRPVPHVSWWGCFGGITFLLFLIQVFTGVLLMFFYAPSASEAHDSILYLAGEAPFGWFFRTLHHWSGTVMVPVLTVHVLRVLFTGAYQKPRDLNWIAGSFLFLFAVGFLLTGHILPWTDSSFWSAAYWTDLVGSLPVIGHQLMLFLRGGEHVTGATLTRFYVFHVFVLPALTTFFLVIHFAMVRKLGIVEPL